MKLFSELSAIETEIIQLDTLTKTVGVIAEGIPNCTPDEVHAAVYHIRDCLESIHENLRGAFDHAWENDRSSSEEK